MNRDMYDDVLDFHNKFNCHIENKPKVPYPEVADLRKTLIEEEYHELKDALSSENLSEIAKESMDLIYVIMGTLISYGIDPKPIWSIVHESNMNKVGGKTRGDGKITKPIDWKSPDVVTEIKIQMGI